jgi:site-specific recombinase XerD
MTLSQFFDEYYRPLKLRGRSANTVRLYANTLKQYEKFLGRQATIEADLNDLQVSRYLEHRSRSRSPFTAEKERNQLCALWRCAADRRMTEMRPCIPVTLIPFRVPTAWSIDQLKTLIATAKVTPGMIGDVPARIWWTALIQVLWQSAERIGAIMCVEKVDYTRPMILVRAEHRKGGKRDKLFTFSDPLCDLLDVLAKSKNGPRLFAWPRGYEYLWNRFGKIVKAAGLEGGRRNKFHQLRRSAATHYAARGGDPTALLDHSSPRITKAYLDPRFIDTGPKPCDVLPGID